MKNFIQDGNTINYTVADTAIKGGEIRMVGDVAAVAVTDGAVGETIAMHVTGVYELPKGTGAITQGAPVYVDAGGTGIVATEEGNKFAGFAWEAADAEATTVLVKINGAAIRTVTVPGA